MPGSSSASSGISGTVVDPDGAVIVNATITLARPQSPATPHVKSASTSNGTFAFTDVAPGPFEVTVEASGFATRKISGNLEPGQNDQLPQIQLEIAAKVVVAVAETQEQVAEEEVHVEETQRVVGVFPNYYVTYQQNPAPLNTRQKYQLAWKASINPVSFGIAAFFAGLEQSANYYSGYGEGLQGYGKRLGATYADSVAGTFIGGAILPSIFKQDPRYFYQGTGTRKARLAHALKSAFICRGDNGRWEPNYSNMLGSLAAGALSNLYYPASDRHGVGLTFGNAALGIAGSAVSGIVEEFFLRRMTSHSSNP